MSTTVAGLALCSQKANACSYATSRPVATDPAVAGAEQQQPVMLDATVKGIQRGGGPTRIVDADGREFFIANSCSSLAVLRLDVTAEDDTTDQSAMRYTVEVSRGVAPEQLGGVELQQVGNNELRFVWPELPEQGLLALDFELRLSAIDLAGNESEPFFLEVFHPGALDSGRPNVANALTPQAVPLTESVASEAREAAGPHRAESEDRSLGWTCSTGATPSSSTPAPGGAVVVASVFALVGVLRRKRREQ